MRFEDVTHRLGATVCDPGDRDDGKPLNVAIPTMARVELWQAVHGGYSWAIMYEPGLPQWSDEENKTWCGYSASYRKIGQTSSRQTIKIDGGPWDSLAKAEEACRRVWKQIRTPQ